MTARDPHASPLGRGLSALFAEPDLPTARSRSLPVELLTPTPLQPRRDFDPAQMEGLVDSVRAHGVLQPLIVRPRPGEAGGYEIVAGERRWRAAQGARLHEVPVVVVELDDRAAREVALVENVQRQDLNPLEEAEGYRRLIDEFSRTQEDLARAVGRSRSHIANMLRLLRLPAAVRDMIAEGTLTAGHARALVAAEDPVGLARMVVARELSVRETERLARPAPDDASPRARPPRDPELDRLAAELGRRLGLDVALRARAGGGVLAIRYTAPEQLDDILRRLGGEEA